MRRARLEGVLLGTAVGDALGVPLEGLPAEVIARRFAPVTRYRLLGRTGFVSDDTEQSALVAQAIAAHPDDLAAAVRRFRGSMLGWFLRLPPFIGWGTLKACVRIALGFAQPGVRSAGNAAAMRAAVVGVAFAEDAGRRRAFSDAFARVTHVDPRAVEGARFVAEVAAHAGAAPLEMVERSVPVVDDPELRGALLRAVALARAGAGVPVAAAELKTTGYVVHTVAFAAFCFARFGATPLPLLQQTYSGGGDTDSIGAIVGAWAGALHGPNAFGAELRAALHDGPFGPTHLTAIARDVEAGRPSARYSAARAMLRNLLLVPVILAHGFRRLLPG